MTEIPEHLLKRSREKRQALSGAAEGGDAAGATPAPAASTPAVAAAAAPAVPKAAPAGPPPKKPDPPYIQAAAARRKMPFWAMGALGFLPIWGFMYARGLTPETVVVEGPMGIGATVYSGNCTSCHLADGAGGAGRPLNNGEVLKTFPRIEDQINLVYTGSQAYEQAGLTLYGDPEREGGAHVPGWGKGAYMPAQGASLTAVEILSVVCHERYAIGGADLAGDYATEYEEWCSPEAPNFIALEGGATFDELEGVGTTPRESVAGTEAAAG